MESKNTYDAIVIGSGISGGWAAKELCEAGLKTIVLERGRDVKHKIDYPTALTDPWNLPLRGNLNTKTASENPIADRCYAFDSSTQHFFVKDNEHPYQQEKPFDWIRGYQVGGKSLIWAKQTQRWSNFEFEAPARDGFAIDWPIRYNDLAPFYAKVEQFVGISGNKDMIPHLPDGVFQKPFELNALEKHIQSQIKKNYTNRQVIIGRCAHLTEPTAAQLALGRGTCQARNLCSRGCPYGAYFSSNSSTLAKAALTNKLTLRPNSVVESILYDEKKKKAIGVRVIDTLTKEVFEYKARIIFVNAGALNTNLLLLNSKSDRFPAGLGNDNGLLGHFLAFHNYRGSANASFEGFEDRYYIGRRPTTAFMPAFRNVYKQEMDFQRGYMVAFSAARQAMPIGEYEYGQSLKDKLSQVGPWNVYMMMQGETMPVYENHVRLSETEKDQWGIPQLVTSIGYQANDLKMLTDFNEQAQEMLSKAGAKAVKITDSKQNPGLDIHEMGGARMGKDKETSVLNKFNQIHSCKNVFVTDGAAMTSTGNQNPSLTLMALTARATAYAINEMKTLRL